MNLEIAVCSELHIKRVNTLCGQNVEFLNIKPFKPSSLRFILILFSHLLLGLPSGLFKFPHQNPVHTCPFSHMCYMLRPSLFQGRNYNCKQKTKEEQGIGCMEQESQLCDFSSLFTFVPYRVFL